jgi:hypothetical protein
MESPDHYDLEYGMAVAFRLEAMRRLQQRLRDQAEPHSTGGKEKEANGDQHR